MTNEKITILTIACIGFLIVFFLGKVFLKIIRSQPTDNKSVLQTIVNTEASKQPDGSGEGLKGRKGFAWVIWLIISIFLVYLIISGNFLDKVK